MNGKWHEPTVQVLVCGTHLGICRKWLRISFIYAKVHRLAKNLEATSNCTCPKGDIQFHSEDQRLLGASVQNLLALTTRQAREIFASRYLCFL